MTTTSLGPSSLLVFGVGLALPIMWFDSLRPPTRVQVVSLESVGHPVRSIRRNLCVAPLGAACSRSLSLSISTRRDKSGDSWCLFVETDARGVREFYSAWSRESYLLFPRQHTCPEFSWHDVFVGAKCGKTRLVLCFWKRCYLCRLLERTLQHLL